MKSKPFNTIEEAIKAGNKIKCFRSGGGLRVFYMWDMDDEAKKSTYYGESYNVKEALRVLLDDVRAGGREYKEVYGVIEEHYLTGEQWKGEDLLDLWIVGGNTLEGEWVDDFKGHEHFEVFLKGLQNRDLPRPIMRKGAAGKTIYWKYKDSDAIRKSRRYIFPGNGAFGCTTQIISNPKKEDPGPYMDVGFVGEGQTFLEAAENAIKQQRESIKTLAEYIEIGNHKAYLRTLKKTRQLQLSKQNKFSKYDSTRNGRGRKRSTQNT